MQFEEGYDPPSVLALLTASKGYIKYFPYTYIPESYIRHLCSLLTDTFLAEESVLSLEPPINVCGDTHGQFTDTIRIFDVVGQPDQNQYLFMGDYVDRGSQSIENMVYLLTLKYMYPNNIFLLRGNHETEEISTVYGLRDECLKRYSFGLYSVFIALFETMPFAAVIGDSIFCVHGGISPEKFTLDTLRAVKRPLDLNSSTVVTDLLWSDPNQRDDGDSGFTPSSRGVSFLFGKKEAKAFLDSNNLSMLIRSHEFCPDGVCLPFGGRGGVATVFSASNYCGTLNSSAVLSIDQNLLLHFTVFQITQEDE